MLIIVVGFYLTEIVIGSVNLAIQSESLYSYLFFSFKFFPIRNLILFHKIKEYFFRLRQLWEFYSLNHNALTDIKNRGI